VSATKKKVLEDWHKVGLTATYFFERLDLHLDKLAAFCLFKKEVP
jgi:hypothetical protein